ncbi:MAG: hypothetical protein KBB26_00785 [Candidatus Omnitrophica bacterium]|nr:hypothetical protein [Candidatus Omnitrophota bacterium]
MMILVLGSGVLATTAILTAFCCGIALGSWLGGKRLQRVGNAVLFFSGALLLTGVWGLGVHSILNFALSLFIKIMQASPPEGMLFFLIRFMLAVAAVLPATMAMGAMVPAMNHILSRYQSAAPSGIFLAYGLNTVGSVLGCLTAGFVFIPAWGMQKTLLVTACINICIALFLIINSRKELSVKSPAASGKSPPDGARSRDFCCDKFVWIYFITGFLSLGYEMAWLRILGIVASNSIITLTVALSVYLLGFSCGSLLLYPKLASRLTARQIFALSNWGAGVATIGLIPVYYQLGNWEMGFLLFLFAPVLDKLNVTGMLFILETTYSIIVMLLPTIFMGMAYPAVCDAVISKKERTAEISGFIFSLGSFGSSLGVAVIALLCIPRIDLTATLAFLCLMSLGLGLLIIYFDKGDRVSQNMFFRLSSIIFIGIAFFHALRGYPFLQEGRVFVQDHQWVFKTEDPAVKLSLLRYKSGYTGTVSVIEAQGLFPDTVRSLKVDGEPVAATFLWAKMDAKMLAHIPLLIHPDPHNAITVGFGSGGTSWSMTRYGIEVDCVEIEPEVVRSAHLFLEQNHDVLNATNLKVIINDARNYFLVSGKKYDVISTDVTNLQYKQNASLYTKEYFQLLKSRLKKNGIASAWVPMGGVNNAEFKILLKTFQDVFPHTSVWFLGERQTSYYAILTGTEDVLEIDYARLKQRMLDPNIKDDLAEVQVRNPAQIISFLFMDEEGVRRYAGDAPLHTDDKSILEFYSTHSLDEKVVLSDIMTYRLRNISGSVKNISRMEEDQIYTLINSGDGMDLRDFKKPRRGRHRRKNFANEPQ